VSAIELVLDRYERPARRGRLPSPPALGGQATNPRCGDVVTIWVETQHGRVARAAFEGHGCTLSMAAADAVAELAEGSSPGAARALDPDAVRRLLGDVPVVTRADCLDVALRALRRALDQPGP
jgi:nitrogen fixation protein NifU and related proteins